MATSVSELIDANPEGPTPEEVTDLQRGLETLITERELRLRDVRNVLAVALSSPERLRGLWKQFVRLGSMASSGRALHPAREGFFRVIDRSLFLIRAVIQAAPRAAELAGGPLPGAEQLPAVLQEVQEFRDLLAERWHDEDDIAELVRSANRPIRAEQLRDLAKKYPPPPAWYDEPQGERPW